MRIVRRSLAVALWGLALCACDGLNIETTKRVPVTVDAGGETDVVDAQDDTRDDAVDSGSDTDVDTGGDTAADTAPDTAPDTATESDTTTDTAEDTGVDTGVAAPNRCGGDAPLTYHGEAAEPGDGCGLCGDGQLFCSGPNDLTCVDASAPNDCGGCGQLAGDIGTTCGLCGDGVWACGAGAAACVGAQAPNGCGGCTRLSLEPGTECSLTGGEAGVVVCAGRESARCASVGTNGCGGTAPLALPAGITGIEARPGVIYEVGCRRGVLLCDGDTLVAVDLEGGNACGGCEPLLGVPGTSCDACGGVWACDVEGGLRCQGGGRNACGGCQRLAAEPGSACSEGGTAGAVICIGAEETGCVPPGATNDCGGIGALTGEPLGGACGDCRDGIVACDTSDALHRRTACVGASEPNACGGCGPLDATVGSACGTCGSGTYLCDATVLSCVGDGGAPAANVCGGCSTLAASPGDPCGRCGSWACDTAVPGRLACDEPAGGCGSVAICGNGAVETGEACDDGNRVTEQCTYGLEGCSVCDGGCRLVSGATSYCGDGLLDAAEVCDEGASNGAGSCSLGCTCSATYHPEGGVCTSNTRACDVPNGTGTETWTGSSYGGCLATACAASYHLESGACVSDTRACTPLPANTTAGSENWNSATGAYGTCVATACVLGYVVTAGTCVLDGSPVGATCASSSDCASDNCAAVPVGFGNNRCAPRNMAWIPAAASFSMGSPVSEAGRNADETQHSVAISRPYFLSNAETTQGEWVGRSGGVNPACFQSITGTSCSAENGNLAAPVEGIDWFSAAAFANAKSVSEGLSECYVLVGCSDLANGWQDGVHSGCTDALFRGLSCNGYRLPTEAEWERAARAGTTTAYYWGSSVDARYLWYTANSLSRTQFSGLKLPNAFRMLDMSGNVAEFVHDRYAAYSGFVTDPTGDAATANGFRVVRGGSWFEAAAASRSAARGSISPSERYSNVGFRLARTAL